MRRGWRSLLAACRRLPPAGGFFGIGGLAEADARFHPGRLSCLSFKEAGSGNQMLVSCLLAARGRPAYLLFGEASAKFDLLSPFRNPELDFLEILETTGKFKTPLCERESAGFLQDLGRVRLPAGAALFIFGAEKLFCLTDREILARQLDCWSAFAAARRAVVVPCFREYLDSRSQILQDCPASAPYLAEVDGGCGSSGWLRFVRWGGASGMAVRLAAGESMALAASVVSVVERTVVGDDAGKNPVFYCRGDIPCDKGIPGHWRAVEHLHDLLRQSEEHPQATLVLAFADGRFRALCELIHRLRRSRPDTLHIAILETWAKLRHHQEILLLHLGADAVVYRELLPSRVIQAIEDLTGQVCCRKVPENLAAALAAGEPDRRSGYLPAPEFCAAVRSMLERTSSLRIAHCLLKLPLASRASAIDALKACRRGRDGSLVTADRDALYVFLFACREGDADAGLASLWGEAGGQLFESSIVSSDRLSMAAALAALLAAAAPDYSFVAMPSGSAPGGGDAGAGQALARKSAEIIPISAAARLRESAPCRSVRPVALPLKGTRHG